MPRKHVLAQGEGAEAALPTWVARDEAEAHASKGAARVPRGRQRSTRRTVSLSRAFSTAAGGTPPYSAWYSSVLKP